MKRIIVLLILTSSFFVNAKENNYRVLDTTWYDIEYKVTSKANAKLYKVRPYKVNNKYIHVYFFKSNNKSQLISYSLDNDDTKYDGKRTYYYENGNIKHIVNYKNNKKEGQFIEYFDNAAVALEGMFADDKKKGLFVVKNKAGVPTIKEYWDNGVKTVILNNSKAIAAGE